MFNLIRIDSYIFRNFFELKIVHSSLYILDWLFKSLEILPALRFY